MRDLGKEIIVSEIWPTGNGRIHSRDELQWPSLDWIMELDISYDESMTRRNARMVFETRQRYIQMLARTAKPRSRQKKRGAVMIPDQKINLLAEEILEI